MKTLTDLAKDAKGVVASVSGDSRFMSRITSIGITPGCEVVMVKNEKHRPLLVYARDTMIALNRNECRNILIEG